jgi:hypothetical protein
MNTSYSPLPPVEKLREFFDYNPATGRISWKAVTGARAKIGSVAGTMSILPTGDQKFNISFNGKVYRAARVAWALATGEDPGRNAVVCANGNIFDLRESNLVKTSHPVRTSARKDTTSGETGIYFAQGKWVAQIKAEGKTHSLGSFSGKEDAVAARKKAEQCLLNSDLDGFSKLVKPKRVASSGHPGVGRNGGKWKARIRAGGKLMHLGTFSTKEEAIAARKKAEVELLNQSATA